jgi:hypothetical protein
VCFQLTGHSSRRSKSTGTECDRIYDGDRGAIVSGAVRSPAIALEPNLGVAITLLNRSVPSFIDLDPALACIIHDPF